MIFRGESIASGAVRFTLLCAFSAFCDQAAGAVGAQSGWPDFAKAGIELSTAPSLLGMRTPSNLRACYCGAAYSTVTPDFRPGA